MGLPDSLKTGQGKPEFMQIFNNKEANVKIWKKKMLVKLVYYQ